MQVFRGKLPTLLELLVVLPFLWLGIGCGLWTLAAVIGFAFPSAECSPKGGIVVVRDVARMFDGAASGWKLRATDEEIAAIEREKFAWFHDRDDEMARNAKWEYRPLYDGERDFPAEFGVTLPPPAAGKSYHCASVFDGGGWRALIVIDKPNREVYYFRGRW